ncbi:MAG: SRPBCC family protein [Mycobacterium sp.]
MSAAVDRTVTDHIPAPPDEVRAYYVDLKNLAAVHPLIVSVNLISDSATDGVRETTYRIKDRVPVGLLTVPATYTAIIRVPVDGPVTSLAMQFPGIRLQSRVSFDPVDGGTRLTESIRISAPRPLLGVTVRGAVAAHTEMLAGIRRHFAG